MTKKKYYHLMEHKKLMNENKVKIQSGLIYGGENENFLPLRKDEINDEDLKNYMIGI